MASERACIRIWRGTARTIWRAGRAPWPAILNTSPISLAERAPDLPLELARAVDRALAREPSERYSSAEHMRKALQQFV